MPTKRQREALARKRNRVDGLCRCGRPVRPPSANVTCPEHYQQGVDERNKEKVSLGEAGLQKRGFTLPIAVVAALDSRAKREERRASLLVEDALRKYLSLG